MEPNSVASERIGAALRALRQMHLREAGDTVGLSVKCLHAVIAELAANGVSSEDLQPLADLEELVERRKAAERAADKVPSLALNHDASEAPNLLQTPRDQRRGAPPSTILLARASALIDLLVRSGQDEPEAAQTAMRQLLAVGVPAPAQGGDSRGWRRLLEFRNALLLGRGPEEARHEYRSFAHDLEAIPPAERVSRMLDGRLWDRRLRPR